MEIHIRPEEPADYAAIYDVNAAAFSTGAEAQLVDQLRREGAVVLSLVAEAGDLVVGHILFSPVDVHSDGGNWPAVALGPMAVLPAYQGQGIGSQLARAGLASCRQMGHDLVFVLGHPTFYPRFGFRPSRPRGVTSTYDVPDEVFMVAELAPDALDGRSGKVHYHPAFASV